jgi:formylglycine-generating enzyme
MLKIKNILTLFIFIFFVLFLYACEEEKDEPHYTVSFESNGGTYVQPLFLNHVSDFPIIQDPTKEGYQFRGWFFDDQTFNESFINYEQLEAKDEKIFTLYAKWDTHFLLRYYSFFDGSIIYETTFSNGEDLSIHPIPNAPDLPNYTFNGWLNLPVNPSEDIVLYAQYQYQLELNEQVYEFVTVGAKDISFTLDIEKEQTTYEKVQSGFLIAKTETTYPLWYDVLNWAKNHGYTFENEGKEGSSGIKGETPIYLEAQQPVTSISWSDIIVWTNALSEKTGFEPVYRTSDNLIVKDAKAIEDGLYIDIVETAKNGFRLPSSKEWSLAARYRNFSGDGAIFVNGRYYTPSNYASGATADVTNEIETRKVAWFVEGHTWLTKPVGQLKPNDLGLFDMSGNVFEWTFSDLNSQLRSVRGGSYSNEVIFQQTRSFISYPLYFTDPFIGFRLTKNI